MPKPNCRNCRGFVSLPLVLVVVAVIAIPLVAYILTKNQIGLSPQAGYPTCDRNSCAYAGSCLLKDKKVIVAGVSYTCRGGNNWEDPSGRITTGDSNGPKVAQLPPSTRPTPTLIVVETVLESDTKSGCLFTLRFDKEDAADPTLKTQAATQMNAIATMIKSGKKPQEVLAQLLPNPASNAVNEVWARRTTPGQTSLQAVNPYEKFQTANAPNFCWANSVVRHSRLGRFFYEANPAFVTQFQQLLPGGISAPFVLYRQTPDKIIEYAYALITR